MKASEDGEKEADLSNGMRFKSPRAVLKPQDTNSRKKAATSRKGGWKNVFKSKIIYASRTHSQLVGHSTIACCIMFYCLCA